MVKRSPEREQFLADVLVGAIEHGGYGFSYAKEYEYEPAAEAFAVITDKYLEPGDEGYRVYARVDIDTIARGLAVIREAKRGEDQELYTAKGKRLYYDGENREALLVADRTNGEDGDVDVVGALAALECGLFGQVVYG